jgi:hypothetical protein
MAAQLCVSVRQGAATQWRQQTEQSNAKEGAEDGDTLLQSLNTPVYGILSQINPFHTLRSPCV